MCGIAGAISLIQQPIPKLDKKLNVMSDLIAHRGPDAKGEWFTDSGTVGLAHRRLSIIDLSSHANQPLQGPGTNTVVCFNGEIYNYQQLRSKLNSNWNFNSYSDTETILANYHSKGIKCLDDLRGMFAFALYDGRDNSLFCARDRFGIKPFYYTQVDNVLYFASEAKALLPVMPNIATNKHALAEYLTFQYTLNGETLFEGIHQLPAGYALKVKNGKIDIWRYWDVKFDIDYDHSETYFKKHLKDLMYDSMSLHTKADVEIGSYVSGGVDSSLVHLLANKHTNAPLAFNGKFTEFSGYDESAFAAEAVAKSGGHLISSEITSRDFEKTFRDIIYHLDFPVAGPGSFAQFMISKVAAEKVKVVLGGQGGDEIFGGYARYTIAYLEQCLKAAIDGTYQDGNYVVTIESIIPNLTMLKEYKPMLKQFWQQGLFEPMENRYFRLIDRSNDLKDEIQWNELNKESVFNRFSDIFNNPNNVKKNAYFDKMTHYDFKCFLPSLLQVEDRMSMAHGLESRVPFLDHPLIEFAATIPADIKFKNGNMKYMLKHAFKDQLPKSITNRRDKMGFPVPLKEWYQGSLKLFINQILESMIENNRPFINGNAVKEVLMNQHFTRKTWGLLCLELWYQTFHDKAKCYRDKII
ncbi:asparagine synthase (glutamine-hydrolyzing) [Saccharobesus litoralis]|uniref:asparagine synthase (glutamine-hydrolyzing) n=1 Tax=Saccharobesus litoralis TaxID=2172099 RepID=A0A2S0VU78_9ALTE|nr:asparagine synthase (glutamine-hydrolyzing) [Saccharobesus litoralis]AWB67771.1 asparagine synthase (glutamine-hydrolyzing) [Saccharobesus litoralis]